MESRAPSQAATAKVVRQRVLDGGDRLWRFEDFRDLPFPAVAQALSRLARGGFVERLSKGIYYRPRQTAFGKSRPNPTAMQRLASSKKPVFPSGVAAANLLGFTTQVAKWSEVATSAQSLPRKLIGSNTVVHARRPEAWSELAESDAALLDFMRHAGSWSELPPAETTTRTLKLLSDRQRFERLLSVAHSEPPRVRAMLGAMAEQLDWPQNVLDGFRESLNPSSRFDFGVFAGLPNARKWQVKGRP